MIQRRPCRGVCRQSNDASNYEVSRHGRLARTRSLSLHLSVLGNKSRFFKVDAEFVFSSHGDRAGSCTPLPRRCRRNSAVRRRAYLDLVGRSPRNGGATAKDEHGAPDYQPFPTKGLDEFPKQSLAIIAHEA